MSAVMAAIHWNGQPLDPSVLGAATAWARSRCPDGAWVWADGCVGLAQADLAILPEDEPGRAAVLGPLRIAASCRLDNRAELLAALPSRSRPRGSSDAALLLAAYEAWGAACVPRLVGDFAFVIWDGRQQQLLAARDPFGARPLFYHAGPDRLLIASDRTQILQDPSVPFAIDEDDLAEYLTPCYQLSSGWDLGHLRGIKVVEPGSLLVARQGRLQIDRFWSPEDHAYVERPEAEWIERYLEALDTAVRCRLRSRDGRVAIALSGGLDSPALAALAARSSPATGVAIHSFSQIFDEFPAIDERVRIGKVLARYPISGHFIVADRLFDPLWLDPAWTPDAVCGVYELTGSAAAPAMRGAITDAGCRVVLTGDMGDTLNTGEPWAYQSLLRRGRFGEALKRLRFDLEASPGSRREALVYGLVLPLLPGPLLRAARGILAANVARLRPVDPHLCAPLARRVRDADRAVKVRLATSHPLRCPVRHETVAGLFPPMVPCTAAPPGPLSYSYPYTDRRLVELVLALPPELKWELDADHGCAEGRHHHRRAMAGLLPPEVLVANPGVSFSEVYARCFTAAAVKGWLLDHPRIHVVERGYVQRELLLAELTRPSAHHLIGHLLALEAWLRAIAPGGAMARLVPPRRPTYAPPPTYTLRAQATDP